MSDPFLCPGTAWSVEAARIARRLAPSSDAQDDLAHETLMRALQHPPADHNMGPWMQRICRNLQVDAWRAEARRRRLTPDDAAPSGAKNGEELALAGERRREVRRAVLALPREQRWALILRYQSGWSFERIGARLGLLEATARTRVHRALATLRRRLGALRVLVGPGPLAFKPALAVLIVLAADPRSLMAPVRAVPAAADQTGSPARPNAGHTHARRPVVTAKNEATPAVEAPARAQRTEAREPPSRPTHSSAVLRLDFENDDVNGVLQRPGEDAPIIVVKDAAHESLIELRTQFVPELIKTLEDL